MESGEHGLGRKLKSAVTPEELGGARLEFRTGDGVSVVYAPLGAGDIHTCYWCGTRKASHQRTPMKTAFGADSRPMCSRCICARTTNEPDRYVLFSCQHQVTDDLGTMEVI